MEVAYYETKGGGAGYESRLDAAEVEGDVLHLFDDLSLNVLVLGVVLEFIYLGVAGDERCLDIHPQLIAA